MAVHAYPLWLQNGSYDATEDRQLLRALRYNAGVMWPDQLKVSQTATASMQTQITSGYAVVDGTTSLITQGSYLVFNDATVTVTHNSADASLPRIDLVVARVQDSAFAGTTDSATIETVTGTPASSPTAPATPTSSVLLAQVLVGAGATSISDANITDKRAIVKLRGTPIPVTSQAQRDSLGAASGQMVVRTDTGALEFYTGSAWKSLRPIDFDPPYAEAAGITSVSATNLAPNLYVSKVITMPAGRFTSGPHVFVSLSNAPGGSQPIVPRVIVNSTTQFTLYCYNTDSSNNATFSNLTIVWHAIQMLPGSASGP